MKSQSRRKLSNLVIDRAALVRLSVPFLILAVIGSLVVFAVHWKVMQALEQTELVGAANLPAMNALLNVQYSITVIGAVGILILSSVCFLIWLILSHRIFGPIVPIRRHVQKLCDGDYTSRIQLRTSDEFRELTEELNQLAEILSQKTGG